MSGGAPVAAAGPVVGLGVDLVDIERFRRSIARRPGLVPRLFRDGDRRVAERAADPAPRLAARFAAKEAVMKALGVGLGAFALRDVEVVSARSGAPSPRLHAGAADLAARRGVASWLLTLTHDAGVAVAVAAAVGPPAPAADGAGLVAELSAADPTATTRFWEDVLGFASVGPTLALGGRHVRIAAGGAAAGGGLRPPGPRLVVEVDDVAAARRRAARHLGAEPAEAADGFVVVDPDGTEVRVRRRGAGLP